MKIQKISMIIDKELFNKNNLHLDGNNINGPSLIKVPKFCKNPLGKYIRMAFYI